MYLQHTGEKGEKGPQEEERWEENNEKTIKHL